MSILSMPCPSVTLDRIIYAINKNLSHNLLSQEFVTVNLGLSYIFLSSQMVINCHNYFESGKQYVTVISSNGNGCPYILIADFLEDLNE